VIVCTSLPSCIEYIGKVIQLFIQLYDLYFGAHLLHYIPLLRHVQYSDSSHLYTYSFRYYMSRAEDDPSIPLGIIDELNMIPVFL